MYSEEYIKERIDPLTQQIEREEELADQEMLILRERHSDAQSVGLGGDYLRSVEDSMKLVGSGLKGLHQELASWKALLEKPK